MNGSGIPVTGITPSTIPTLTSTWNRIIDARPTATIRPSASPARQPMSSTRHSSSAKSASRTSPPTRPSSSATTVKMKSVDCTGRNPSWFWRPAVSPWPNQPPEPTAFSAWTS